MVRGAEIGLLVMGLIALCTGKLTLFKGRVVYGPAARVLGLIACAPFPLSFLAGVVYGIAKRGAINPASDSFRWTMFVIEFSIVIACLALIYIIGLAIADPAGVQGGERKSALDISINEPVPPAAPSNVKGFLLIAGLGVGVFLASLMFIGAWPTVKEKLGIGQLNEAPDDDIDAIPPAPPIAGPVPDALLPASWQARVERMLSFNRPTLAGAYDRVGKTNPKWDEHARTALELTALHFSNQYAPHAQPKDIRTATQKAISAGCNDPLILYLHYRFADAKTPDAELEQGFARAAKAMQASAYPAFRRAAAVWKAAEYKVKRADDPAARAEALRLIAATLRLLPVSARQDEHCRDLQGLWYVHVHDAQMAYKQLGEDSERSWRSIDELLASEKALEPTRLLFKGEFHIDWAWQARGYGYANTVTEAKALKFEQRLLIARDALEKSWQLSPGHEPARFMLTVELGQSRGRAEMEKWFERAIQFGPTFDVCTRKLEWLHPKWYGSKEEMLKFGRTCRDSQSWEWGLPRIMVETHERIAAMLPSEAAKSSYFRQPDVAADIIYVYAKTFEHNPDDAQNRSWYAYYCYKCGHPRRARRQFELLGDKLWWNDAATEKLMKEARSKTMNVGPPPKITNG